MILLIDNYDSFTYNLVDYLERLGKQVEVFRNDVFDIQSLEEQRWEGVLLSPGPGIPSAAGALMPILKSAIGKLPVLGVCLGHQAIGEMFGASLIRAIKPMHGKESLISHDDFGVFQGLPNPLSVVKYHSLVLDESTMPSELLVTARSLEGEIMGCRHKSLPIEGVQFHPEAWLTDRGIDVLANWVSGL